MTKPRVKIKATEIAAEVRDGIADSALMAKYRISARQLESILQRILNAGLITEAELAARSKKSDALSSRAIIDLRNSFQELDDEEDTKTTNTNTTNTNTITSDSRMRAPAGTSKAKGRTTHKRRVKAKHLVSDIEKGISDDAIMNKYNLTPRQLEYLLQRLVETGAIQEMKLWERTSLSSTQVTKAFVDVQRSISELDD